MLSHKKYLIIGIPHTVPKSVSNLKNGLTRCVFIFKGTHDIL